MSETTSWEASQNLWSVTTSRLHFYHGAGKENITESHLCSTFNYFFLSHIFLTNLCSLTHLNELTHIYNMLNHILNEQHQFTVTESETLPAVTIQKHDLDCIASNKTLLKHCSYDCVTFHDMQAYQKVACVCGSGPYNRLYMFYLCFSIV